MTPTQRTLELLRQRGWLYGVVERFIAFAGPHGKRIDFLHCFDIIAVTDDAIVGVQSCGQDWSGHVKTLTGPDVRENLVAWLRHGKAELIGWRKIKAIKADGKKGKAMRWKPRIGDVVVQDNEVKVIERKDD